jgi:hypothetical protein
VSAAQTIAALNAPFVPSPRIFKGDKDDNAVKAWNKRQASLSAIEANGTFFGAEGTSPEQAELFDTMEEAFRFVPAQTVQGILAKLWVALAHFGPPPINCKDEARRGEVQAEHDAVRRGDFDEVSTFIGGWDFGEEVLFSAIRDLERWTQFECVYCGPKGKPSTVQDL